MIMNMIAAGSGGGGGSDVPSGTILPAVISGSMVKSVSYEMLVAGCDDGLFYTFYPSNGPFFYRYQIGTGAIQRAGVPVRNNALSFAGGKIYAINDTVVYEYNNSTNSWALKTITGWPTTNLTCHPVSHNGVMYFISGSSVSNVRLYSFNGSTVTTINTPPVVPSNPHRSWLAVVDNNIYLIDLYNAHVYHSALSGGAWTTGVDLSSYSANVNKIVVPIGNDIHLIGGTDSNTTHLIYHTSNNTITTGTAFASPGVSDGYWGEYKNIKWIIAHEGNSSDSSTVRTVWCIT